MQDAKTFNLSSNIVSMQNMVDVSRFSPCLINLIRNKNICCGLKKCGALIGWFARARANLLRDKLSLMKNEQQSQILLVKVDPRSTFRNNFLQPATNIFVATILQSLLSPKTRFLDGEVIWLLIMLRPSMKTEVNTLASQNPSYQISVIGHPLGGAMTSLASTWLAYYNVAPRKNIILYTFGMPRVGNYDYALQHDQLVNNSWRVVNDNDLVPHFPTAFSVSIFNGPYHHGVEAFYSQEATSVYSPRNECHMQLL